MYLYLSLASPADSPDAAAVDVAAAADAAAATSLTRH